MTTVDVPVEQIVAGDRVVLPRGGERDVVRVQRYPGEHGFADLHVIVYADTALHAWENRAQDKGRWSTASVACEKSIARRAGETVKAIR